MKKILIAVAVLAILGGGGYYWKTKTGKKEVRYVSVEVVSKTISEFVETTGAVAPMNRVEIDPSASGRIEEILVQEGDTVHTGEVLALMSSSGPGGHPGRGARAERRPVQALAGHL